MPLIPGHWLGLGWIASRALFAAATSIATEDKEHYRELERIYSGLEVDDRCLPRIAYALNTLGFYKDALKVANKALSTENENLYGKNYYIDGYTYRGLALHGMGEKDAAATAFDIALERIAEQKSHPPYNGISEQYWERIHSIIAAVYNPAAQAIAHNYIL